MVSTTHSPRRFLLENDCSNEDSVWTTCKRVPTVWLRLVETYSNCIKLCLQKPSLLHGLGGIQYYENKVGSLGHFMTLSKNQISQIRRPLPATTCRPLPRPCAAPSTMPGRSSNWMRTPVTSSFNKSYSWVDSTLPLYSSTPGIAVKVVNSYAAASLAVFVTFDKTRRINDQRDTIARSSRVDFPTDGNPNIHSALLRWGRRHRTDHDDSCITRFLDIEAWKDPLSHCTSVKRTETGLFRHHLTLQLVQAVAPDT